MVVGYCYIPCEIIVLVLNYTLVMVDWADACCCMIMIVQIMLIDLDLSDVYHSIS